MLNLRAFSVDSVKLVKHLIQVTRGLLTIGILQGQRTQQLRFNS